LDADILVDNRALGLSGFGFPRYVQLRQLAAGLARGAHVRLLYLLVDLIPINGKMAGCLDADFDDISVDATYTDLDIIADHDPFVHLAA
jgi:hypothetical protein